MKAEGFTQEPPGATARDGTARFAPGNDAEAGGGVGREALPVGHQAAGGEAFPDLAQADEVAPMLEARRAAKPKAL